jgi:hypothetical protein
MEVQYDFISNNKLPYINALRYSEQIFCPGT